MKTLDEILHFIIQRHSYGNINYYDLKYLHHFFNGKKEIVELGTCMGTTTKIFSMLSEHVTTIDIFEKIDLIEDKEQQEFYKKTFSGNKNTYENIKKRLEKQKNITIIQNVSYKAAEEFKDNSFDGIFIDADHSYKGVKKDFESWYPKIKIDGVIVFHDIFKGSHIEEYYNLELKTNKGIIENMIPDKDKNLTTVRGFVKCEQS